MKKTYKILMVCCIAFSLNGCKNGGDERVVASHVSECAFRRGGLSSNDFCDLSIFKVVSQGDVFLGRHVFTVAYALKEGGNGLLLAPTQETLTNGDFLSCVRVNDSNVELHSGIHAMMSKPGIYVVEIAGTLEATRGGWCKYELQNPLIMDARFVREEKGSE